MNLTSNLFLRAVLLAAAVALLGTACGGDDDGGGDPGDTDNILTNGGFEDGLNGWNTRSDAVIASDAQPHTGSSSLAINLAVTEDSTANGVESAVQEANPEEVPEFMSFDYFVEDWVRGTDNQYIEAVIIVTGSGTGMPECPGGEPCPNVQMRYVLAGVTSVPTEVLNARWRFIGEDEPVVGEWLHFETDVRNDFTEEWGSLPNALESVKIQFEVRYDERDPNETDTAAQVFWDDVYLGPR